MVNIEACKQQMWLTSAEVAKILRVSTKTLGVWRKKHGSSMQSGKLYWQKHGERDYFYLASCVFDHPKIATNASVNG